MASADRRSAFVLPPMLLAWVFFQGIAEHNPSPTATTPAPQSTQAQDSAQSSPSDAAKQGTSNMTENGAMTGTGLEKQGTNESTAESSDNASEGTSANTSVTSNSAETALGTLNTGSDQNYSGGHYLSGSSTQKERFTKPASVREPAIVKGKSESSETPSPNSNTKDLNNNPFQSLESDWLGKSSLDETDYPGAKTNEKVVQEGFDDSDKEEPAESSFENSDEGEFDSLIYLMKRGDYVRARRVLTDLESNERTMANPKKRAMLKQMRNTIEALLE